MIIRTVIAAGAAILLAGPAASVALAQEGRGEPRSAAESFYFQGDNLRHATYIATELAFDGKVVKGAPFSAEATSESIQTLADGNRIVRTSTTTLYRDGEGRTRREQSMRSLGPWSAPADAGRVVIINDPVAGLTAILDPDARTARTIPSQVVYLTKPETGTGVSGRGVIILDRAAAPGAGAGRGAAAGAASGGAAAAERRAQRVATEREALEAAAAQGAGVGAGSFYTPSAEVHAEGTISFQVTVPDNVKRESLGTREFDGVRAEGSQTTITIEAGEIGNERPIEIVSERWYSPELQTVVYSRHSDPRFGETIYKLTNITRAEPDGSLFAVPSGFTVVGGVTPVRPGFTFERRDERKYQRKVVEAKARKRQ